MQIGEPKVVLLSATPDAERHIERCGRVCYRSEFIIGEGSAQEFIRRVVARGHESVLEHAAATLLFTTDIGVSREADRHRIASFSMESTRFCNYGKERFGGGLEFLPMLDGLTPLQRARRAALLQEIERVYLAEVTEGVKPQQARDVLPLCLRTEYAWTANLREWRHVLRLRLAPAAHPQMRAVMRAALGILRGVAPTVFEDISAEG